MKHSHLWILTALAAAIPFVVGCDDDSPSTSPPPSVGTPVADFSLRDVNATSPSFDQDVSPRQHLSRISAWYFGSAT